jgi:hypothetical protein
MTILAEKKVPVTAIPTAMPTCRWVAIRAEAIPRWSLVTAPMMMLLFEG